MLFVLTFKLGDMALGPMVRPFWVDRHFTPLQIGAIPGTIGVVSYPALGRLLQLPDGAYALLCGATLHEVPQVLAAAFARDFDADHGATPETILRRSEHGRYLEGLGFEEDIPVCAAVDAVPVVPHLKEGRIMAPAAAVTAGKK